jgi:hypothetical protein
MPPTVTTWAQVFDDAVKIGLGALIGGFFAWLVARYNAKGAIQKLIFERRSKILSDAAQTLELLFHSFIKYSNHLHGIAGASKDKPKNPMGQAVCDRFLAERANEAVNLQSQMTEPLEQSLTAQSQLMLLGEEECRKKAEALCAAIITANASYKFDGTSFTIEHSNTTREAVAECREAFYREMQKAFRKM